MEMNSMKPVRILFFIAGVVPTAEEQQAAAELNGAQVVFRNASAVPAEKHSLEICDGVAGEVPDLYAEAFPDAAEAIKKRKEELKALASKVGDSAAPKAKGNQTPLKTPAGNAPGWNANK